MPKEHGDAHLLDHHSDRHLEHHEDYHRGVHGDVYVDHHDTKDTDFSKDYRIGPLPPHTVVDPTIFGDDFDAHYH